MMDIERKPSRDELDLYRQLRDSGLLFELNRSILHLFGLSLGVMWDHADTEQAEPVRLFLHSCDDDAGRIFPGDDYEDGQQKFMKFIEEEGADRIAGRKEHYGFATQRPVYFDIKSAIAEATIDTRKRGK